jgi:hypothetical protein
MPSPTILFSKDLTIWSIVFSLTSKSMEDGFGVVGESESEDEDGVTPGTGAKLRVHGSTERFGVVLGALTCRP